MTDSLRRRLTGVAVLGALGLLPAVPAATALTGGQRLFGGLLARDAGVSAPIKALLGAGGGGFVDPKILIADLTGDRRADAVVLVGSGGAAGDVALYVVSRDGANGRLGNLRVLLKDIGQTRTKDPCASALLFGCASPPRRHTLGGLVLLLLLQPFHALEQRGEPARNHTDDASGDGHSRDEKWVHLARASCSAARMTAAGGVTPVHVSKLSIACCSSISLPSCARWPRAVAAATRSTGRR